MLKEASMQRVYTDTFKLFYDPFGGDRYGAVWDPILKEPRPFRVLGGFNSIPVAKVRVLILCSREYMLMMIGLLDNRKVERQGVGDA